MQIPILVEPTAEHNFRASTGAPLHLHVEASTQDEAVDRLRQLIEHRLAAGAQLVELNLPSTQSHPLAKYVGMFKDNPLLQEWKDAMAEYRNQAEIDANLP
jgi:hypothetical protein